MEITNKGFSLVEVLVALVVMAVGMLGIAGLYVESLRSTRTAVLRTSAVGLATDMANRIRSNSSEKTAYGGYSKEISDKISVRTPCADPCSGAALTSFDKTSWDYDISQQLPLPATGAIEIPEGSVATDIIPVTIRLSWPETGQEDAVSYELVMLL
jgi:type IV pilus assembly protein PilV